MKHYKTSDFLAVATIEITIFVAAPTVSSGQDAFTHTLQSLEVASGTPASFSRINRAMPRISALVRQRIRR